MGAGDRVLVLWGRHSSRSRVLLFAIGYVRGCPGFSINQGMKMIALVEKVTMVGVGEVYGFGREKYECGRILIR